MVIAQASYEWLPTRDEDWRRALAVQGALWRSGRVRAVGFPDLLVAAVAERERVTVLHYYGSCRSLRLWQRVGVGVPALVGLLGAILVAASP